jgi:hypothetical protein
VTLEEDERKLPMHTTEQHELSSADYLEKALSDLDQARRDAAEELRSMIDAAISRSREALDHLKVDAEDRAGQIKASTEDRAAEWQQMLEEASDDARREFGIRAVGAQRSEDALKAMSEEIKHRKKELAASQ